MFRKWNFIMKRNILNKNMNQRDFWVFRSVINLHTKWFIHRQTEALNKTLNNVLNVTNSHRASLKLLPPFTIHDWGFTRSSCFSWKTSDSVAGKTIHFDENSQFITSSRVLRGATRFFGKLTNFSGSKIVGNYYVKIIVKTIDRWKRSTRTMRNQFQFFT